MDEKILTLRARTRRLHHTLGRIEALWERLEALEPGPRQEGISHLLAQALDRTEGAEVEEPLTARVLDEAGLPPEDHRDGAALLVRLGGVDAGFALDSLEVLVVLCEALLESEQDPFVGRTEQAWIDDFHRLVHDDPDTPLAALPASVAERWRSLKGIAERLEGARELAFEMARVRALRQLVAWGLGRARVPQGGRGGAVLALRVGEFMLQEHARA